MPPPRPTQPRRPSIVSDWASSSVLRPPPRPAERLGGPSPDRSVISEAIQVRPPRTRGAPNPTGESCVGGRVPPTGPSSPGLRCEAPDCNPTTWPGNEYPDERAIPQAIVRDKAQVIGKSGPAVARGQ